jgi:FkbM family methyltransferase
MKSNEVVYRGKNVFSPIYLVKLLLDNTLHRIAKSHVTKFPQMAIYSFDHIGIAINIEGRYEKSSLDIVSDFMNNYIKIDHNSTVLDIGANIGNHSLYFSSLFSKVYAFEPHPKTYKLLEFNCSDLNIDTFNFGLSSEDATVKFDVDPNNMGHAFIIDGELNKDISSNMEIEVKKLDDLSEIDRTNISLIKIDVEGHELQALEGALTTIKDNRPVILFEQHPHDFSNGTSEVVELLRNVDYKFYTIENRLRFGNNAITKAISLCLRSLFGFQKLILATSTFESRLYEMIIAVPNGKVK